MALLSKTLRIKPNVVVNQLFCNRVQFPNLCFFLVNPFLKLWFLLLGRQQQSKSAPPGNVKRVIYIHPFNLQKSPSRTFLHYLSLHSTFHLHSTKHDTPTSLFTIPCPPLITGWLLFETFFPWTPLSQLLPLSLMFPHLPSRQLISFPFVFPLQPLSPPPAPTLFPQLQSTHAWRSHLYVCMFVCT